MLHVLSDELKVALISRVTIETIRKNRHLLSVGDTADWIAFIEKGFAKLCYDIPNHERIICILKSGEIASSMSSYHSNLPSRLAIVALDETTI